MTRSARTKVLDRAELKALVDFHATESDKNTHNYEVVIPTQISNSMRIPVTKGMQEVSGI